LQERERGGEQDQLQNEAADKRKSAGEVRQTCERGKEDKGFIVDLWRGLFHCKNAIDDVYIHTCVYILTYVYIYDIMCVCDCICIC